MKHNRKALALLLLLCLLLPVSRGLAQPAVREVPQLTGAGLSLLPLDLHEPALLMAVLGNRLALLNYGEVAQEEQVVQEERHLYLYGFPTMNLLAQATLEPSWRLDYLAYDHLGFLSDGRIYVMSLQTGTLLVYDQDLGSREEVVFGPAETFHTALVQEDGAFIWAADLEGQITCYEVASGQGRQLKPQLPPGWRLDQFLSAKDGRLRSRYDREGMTAVVEMDLQGRSTITPVLPGVTWLYGHQALYSGRSLALLYTPGQKELMQLGAWEHWESPLSLSGEALLTIRYLEDQVVLKRYDLDHRLLGNRLDLPHALGELHFSYAQDIGEGKVLLMYQGMDVVTQVLYLWDALAAPLNTEAGIRITDIGAFAGENDAQALEIGRRHGLQLLLRQAGTGFVNDVYVAQPSLEELWIRDALQDVAAFLDSLPPGLLQEALVPPHDRFAIYLAGGILQTGQEGIMSAAGFSAQDGSLRYIVLDIRDSGRMRLLAHEFMHLLEDRLEQAAGQSPWPLLWYWQRLGPKEAPDYGFHFRYTNEEGYTLWDTAYTAAAFDAEARPEAVWFIDAYSRTMPIEDRARIFEYLLLPTSYEDPFVYPHLKRKAQVLAALLREAFPSVAALEQAPWETGLDKIKGEELLKTVYEELQALE